MRNWQARIGDILSNLEQIGGFVAGMDFDAFTKDQKTIYAVLTGFAVIGEAARFVPEEVRNAHPTVPWNMMIRMRNVLIHEYYRVNLEIVWQTIEEDFPPMVPKLREMLK